MCGIAGFINTDGNPVLHTGTILEMLKVQQHRGPDDKGLVAFSFFSGESKNLNTLQTSKINEQFEGILGFNRLSILDLSINGHQPMSSYDSKVILALNGEIYNAFDFKEDLISDGYVFRSRTDTEVVLALYLKYGLSGMLERLNGMFAIVIIDLRNQSIFIARDRFGIKPMYYIFNKHILAFASELKSFGYIENFEFQLSPDKVDEYLMFRNNLTDTLFNNIYSINPGHFLVYSPDHGLSIKQYFNINDYHRVSQPESNLESYISKLEQWLTKSVRSQLMSDVKLGCQLSGGIDSSIVTWLANKDSAKGNFEAVSIIFSDQRFNEEKYIDIISGKVGIASHKFLLDPIYYLDNIEKATWHLETPINHPNTIGIYRLSQLAKKFVTVLLSGEGADEVFGGYERFYEINFPLKSKSLLRVARSHILNPKVLLKSLNNDNRIIMASSFMSEAVAKELKGDFRYERAIEERIMRLSSLSGTLFDRQVKYELLSYLPDLLIRQDKMSMAHSIENRVPFLDNDLVQNSFSIPSEYLLLSKYNSKFNSQKYLLKKMLAANFGDSFAFRQKMGFGIPIAEFFIEKRFQEYLIDKVLPGIRDRGIFNYKLIETWLPNIRRIKNSELEALWIIISFEIWASIFLDNRL